MKIAISAESTVDLQEDLLKKYDIHTVPFSIIMGEEEFLDGQVDGNKIFDFVKQTKKLPKTSAVNEYQYDEYFAGLLKNYDAIIHFSLSSEMSSAYRNACLSAKKFDNVFVVDTRTLSTGIALLAIKASEMAARGEGIKTIVDSCTAAIEKLSVSFVLDTLQYLYRGGRCSAIAMFGANLLSIKPSIVVREGVMKVGKKYRGKFAQVVEKYCIDTLSQYPEVEKAHVFVTHSHACPEAVEAARKCLEQKGFVAIHETIAGGTISSHCGPSCLGILFITK